MRLRSMDRVNTESFVMQGRRLTGKAAAVATAAHSTARKAIFDILIALMGAGVAQLDLLGCGLEYNEALALAAALRENRTVKTVIFPDGEVESLHRYLLGVVLWITVRHACWGTSRQ